MAIPMKGAQLSEEYAEALQSACKFPNMKNVGIHFPKHWSIPDRHLWYTGQTCESFSFRSDVLKTLQRGFNNPRYPTLNVRSLSINNLQSVRSIAINSSDHFCSVLSRLSELLLKVIIEWEAASTGRSWRIPAMYHFFQLPQADFRGLHFPKLQKLELGNYTFSHDWQLHWILSHGETLEELTLDHCPIMHYMRHSRLLDDQGYAIDPIRESDLVSTWKYDARWSSYFAKMERELLKLKTFRYRIGPWGFPDENHFEDDIIDDEGVGSEAYIAFDRGIGPSPWIQNEQTFIMLIF